MSVIPEAAVEAALGELPIEAARFFNKARMRNILEAAAPHMRFELQCLSLIDEMD